MSIVHQAADFVMKPPIIYGLPFSQPVRAVLWLLLNKRQPFEFRMVNPGHPGKNGSRHPEFLEKNPGGTIPCLEEAESGFSIGEAHAIMTYLCRSRGWTDLYPDNAQDQARIDAYLHFHHRNVREASMMVAARVRKDLNFSQEMQVNSQRLFLQAAKILDSHYLKSSEFLLGDTLSIADFAACAEVGQLSSDYTNILDLSEFPRLSQWLERMKQVPGYAEVHFPLQEIGDIRDEPPSIDTLRSANVGGLEILTKAVAQFS
jgi:glutathione S-transferase